MKGEINEGTFVYIYLYKKNVMFKVHFEYFAL